MVFEIRIRENSGLLRPVPEFLRQIYGEWGGDGQRCKELRRQFQAIAPVDAAEYVFVETDMLPCDAGVKGIFAVGADAPLNARISRETALGELCLAITGKRLHKNAALSLEVVMRLLLRLLLPVLVTGESGDVARFTLSNVLELFPISEAELVEGLGQKPATVLSAPKDDEPF